LILVSNNNSAETAANEMLLRVRTPVGVRCVRVDAANVGVCRETFETLECRPLLDWERDQVQSASDLLCELMLKGVR
jgi:hypothetical protein